MSSFVNQILQYHLKNPKLLTWEQSQVLQFSGIIGLRINNLKSKEKMR